MLMVETARPVTELPTQGRFEAWAHVWYKNYPNDSPWFRMFNIGSAEKVGRWLGLPGSVLEPQLVIDALTEFNPKFRTGAMIRPEVLATLSLVHIYEDVNLPYRERKKHTDVLMRAAFPVAETWPDEELRVDTPVVTDRYGKGFVQIDGRPSPVVSVPLTVEEQGAVELCTLIPTFQHRIRPAVYTLLHYMHSETGDPSLLETIYLPESGHATMLGRA